MSLATEQGSSGPASCRGLPGRCRARRGWVLAVLSVSLALAAMDTTALNVALPSIGRDLHASTGELQWIVDAYVLVYGSLLLTAGRVADRVGRRKVMIAGLVVFGVTSILAATASSPSILIAMRALMGIGGATLTPTTLAILYDVFPEKAERARAVAIWSGALGLGVAIGPLVGGLLLERFWWGSVLLANVPVVLLAVVGGLAVVPESADPGAPKLDLAGVVLSSGGLALGLWGIIEAPSLGWSSVATLASLAGAVVALVAFVFVERHSDHPMLLLSLYRDRRFALASVVSVLSFFTVFSVLFVLTLYLQLVLGYSPLAAGLRILPAAATILVAAPLSDVISRRIGGKATATIGLLLLAAGSAWLSVSSSSSGYTHVAQALVPFGFGFGFVLPPIIEAVLGALPPEKVAVGSAANSTAEQVGGALGIAVVGSVLTSVIAARLGTLARAARVRPGPTSFTKALSLAQRLSPSLRSRVLEAVRVAFASGLHAALPIAAGVSLVAAIVVVLFLPSEARPGHSR